MRQNAETRKIALLKESNGRCYYCGILLCFRDCRIEHVIPKSKGGRNHSSNYVASCDKCNRQKGTRTVQELKNFILTKNPIYTFLFYFESAGLKLKGSVNNPPLTKSILEGRFLNKGVISGKN
jgi:hypothetical protein